MSIRVFLTPLEGIPEDAVVFHGEQFDFNVLEDCVVIYLVENGITKGTVAAFPLRNVRYVANTILSGEPA